MPSTLPLALAAHAPPVPSLLLPSPSLLSPGVQYVARVAHTSALDIVSFRTLPRGRLEVADTLLGIPHEAEACMVSWLEKPTCLECLGPAVPLPLP